MQAAQESEFNKQKIIFTCILITIIIFRCRNILRYLCIPQWLRLPEDVLRIGTRRPNNDILRNPCRLYDYFVNVWRRHSRARLTDVEHLVCCIRLQSSCISWGYLRHFQRNTFEQHNIELRHLCCYNWRNCCSPTPLEPDESYPWYYYFLFVWCLCLCPPMHLLPFPLRLTIQSETILLLLSFNHRQWS